MVKDPMLTVLKIGTCVAIALLPLSVARGHSFDTGSFVWALNSGDIEVRPEPKGEAAEASRSARSRDAVACANGGSSSTPDNQPSYQRFKLC